MRSLDEVFQLLSVVEKARGHPRLKVIHDRAMEALEAHAADLEKQTESVQETAKKPTPIYQGPLHRREDD